MAKHRPEATSSPRSSTSSRATRSTKRPSKLPEGAGRTAFERAVAAFALDEIRFVARPLELARASLARTGLFVLGESHGIAETASAILTLVRALGIRSLALEWSFDEVGGLVQHAVETGHFDLDELWAIPAGGDLFSGDGRFTAGHVRVLEHLVQSGALVDVVPIDRLDQDPPFQDDREVDMAERLLAALRPELPMLAVVGFFHASREALEGVESMFFHLERLLPELANGVLERAEHPVNRPVDAVFRLPRATPAIVPARS